MKGRFTTRTLSQDTIVLARAMLASMCIAIAAYACAMPQYLAEFNKKYDIKQASTLGKARCTICHSSMDGGKRNVYGKDVEAALRKLKVDSVDSKVLESVEPLDSNKDGTKNIDKIHADRLPGKVDR